MDNSTLPINRLRKETVLVFYAENSLNQRVLNIRDYTDISPMMSRLSQWLEFKSEEHWWLMYKYRHNNQEIRNFEYAHHEELKTIPEETDHHNLEAALSQQSTSCVRPRANETSGNPPIRNKTAPKPKLILIAFSQRARKSIPANTWTRKDCEFENTSKYFTNPMTHKLSLIRRSNTIEICFDKHAKCWAKNNWNREIWIVVHSRFTDKPRKKCWINARSRSTDNPRKECREDQNGTMIFLPCNTKTQ